MEIADPKTAINTMKDPIFGYWMACAKMENFPINPAVSGIPAMDNIETAAATAIIGSECAKPRKALYEVSRLSFSTQIKQDITPIVAIE